MSRVLNSFALLGDEEDDDVTVLVEHFAKKVGLAASDSTALDQSGKDTGYSVYIGNLPPDATIDHVLHTFSDFGPIKYGGIQVRSSKQGFCFGFVEFESSSSAQKALEASPVLIGEQNVFVEEKRASRGEGPVPGRGGFRRNERERFGNEQEYGPRHNYFDGPNGNGRGGSMGRGRGRAFNNDNVVGDEKEGNAGNGYANGNGSLRSYGNDRRPRRGGYGGNYGNGGNHVYRERRDGKNNGSHEQQSSNGDVKETANGDDSVAVDSESSKAVSEGDAAPVTEEPREVVAKETPQGKLAKAEDGYAKKKQEEYQKWLAQYRTWKTLGEYEKVVAEKRKALEALKNEERKVAADKDLEAMELLGKKKKDAALLVVKAPRLKKKPSLDKAEESTNLKEEKTRKVALSIVEGFLKPAHGNNSSSAEPGLDRSGSKKDGSGVAHIPINDQCEFPDLKGAARAV